MGTALTQVKVAVSPGIASAFKVACASANVSMASELSRFMTDYAKGTVTNKYAPDYTTRRKRRGIVKRILNELAEIKAAEERLIDNAPENLQVAPIYEVATEYIDMLDETIELLSIMVP